LRIDTGREQSFVVVKEERDGAKVIVPVVAAMMAEARLHAIDVIIADPFVSTHHVNENDNGKVQQVAEVWVSIADSCNCSVELVHHTRKEPDGVATADSSRGGSALKDKTRSMRVINRMSEEDAKKWGIRSDERFRYSRVSDGKVNMKPESARAEGWRKMVSVLMPNGGQDERGILLAGDEVGVITPWAPPESGDILDELGTETVDKIKGLFATGMRQDIRSSDWAGYRLGEGLGLQPRVNENDKARSNDIIKALLKAEILKITYITDTYKKRDIPHLITA